MRTRLALLASGLLLAAGPACAGDAEDAAAKVVEKLGGAVEHDEADPAHPVVAVNLAATPTTDARLKALAALKALKKLDLTVCLGVGDEGMKQVAALKRLETLNICYTGVTDAGLKRMAGLTKLRTLNLTGDKVTDDGVAALQKALQDCKIAR
jgi:hypothetical protein